MATIPLYDKRMSPSGATARVEARPVLGSMDAAAAPYRALSQVGEAVSGIGQQIGAYADRLSTDEARAEQYRINQEMQNDEMAARQALQTITDPEEVKKQAEKILQDQAEKWGSREVHKKNAAMYKVLNETRQQRLQVAMLGNGGIYDMKRIVYADSTYAAEQDKIERGRPISDPTSGEERSSTREDYRRVLDERAKLNDKITPEYISKALEGFDSKREYYSVHDSIGALSSQYQNGILSEQEYAASLVGLLNRVNDPRSVMDIDTRQQAKTAVNASIAGLSKTVAKSFSDNQKLLADIDKMVEKGEFNVGVLRRLLMTHDQDAVDMITDYLEGHQGFLSTHQGSSRDMITVLSRFDQDRNYTRAMKELKKIEDPSIRYLGVLAVGRRVSDAVDRGEDIRSPAAWWDPLMGRMELTTQPIRDKKGEALKFPFTDVEIRTWDWRPSVAPDPFNESFMNSLRAHQQYAPDPDEFVKKNMRSLYTFRDKNPNPTPEQTDEFLKELFDPYTRKSIQDSYKRNLRK
jgi:hypothetical protein